MMTIPLHHHDMESHIICDKNGKAVMDLSDDMDSDYILLSVNSHDELLSSLNAMSKAFITISQNIPKNFQIGIAEAFEIETAKVNADKAIAKAEGK